MELFRVCEELIWFIITHIIQQNKNVKSKISNWLQNMENQTKPQETLAKQDEIVQIPSNSEVDVHPETGAYHFTETETDCEVVSSIWVAL